MARPSQTHMASPLDHAWYVLKARTERDQSSIHGEYGAPGKFRQPQTMKDIEPPEPGPARSSKNNAMKREMARQRKDAQEGEKRDPLEMEEEEQMVSEMAPEHFQQERPKPDPVSPEFIQQLMAEGGSFGLPPSLQRHVAAERLKDMG